MPNLSGAYQVEYDNDEYTFFLTVELDSSGDCVGHTIDDVIDDEGNSVAGSQKEWTTYLRDIGAWDDIIERANARALEG